MSDSLHSPEEVRQLFHKHVPNVAAGIIELVAIVCDPGRVTVAVRFHDREVDTVAACSGVRGLYARSISRELGSKITIVLWSESPESFILHALGSLGPSAVNTPRVTLEPATHQARVHVDQETLSCFDGDQGLRVSIASRLVGWDIRLVPRDHT